jgi:hypothetical protein
VNRAPVVLATLAVAVVVTALGAAPLAHAQSASVQAQSLFDEGRKLIKAGKIAEACTAFESSHKLDPAVTTLLNLAECREKNHQLATAWGAFVDANRMARASKNARLSRVASKYARKLEPRLSRLTINVPADHRVAGLEIRRGDELVDPAGWNHALPIDGGTYTISARAPGHAPWSVTRTIKNDRDLQTIEVPRLVEARSAPVATGPAKSPAGRPASPPASPADRGSPAAPRSVASGPGPRGASPERATIPTSPGRADRSGLEQAEQPEQPGQVGGRSLVLPAALGVGALVLGGGAIAFHLSGNSTYERAKEATDPAQRDSLYRSANNRRYLAQGFGIAALGAAGAAVYFTLRGGESRASTTAMTPVVSPELAGVALVGRW